MIHIPDDFETLVAKHAKLEDPADIRRKRDRFVHTYLGKRRLRLFGSIAVLALLCSAVIVGLSMLEYSQDVRKQASELPSIAQQIPTP